ncbi:MAG: STAS domain-containing protein [Thermodesulfobacteriota bacterium]
MDIAVAQTGNSARIMLKGHVDERGAEALKAGLTDLPWDSLKEVVFDFRDVTRIGSAGIGQLLLFYKNLTGAGGIMRLEGVPAATYELFQGLKLDTLFSMTKV